MSLRLAWIRGDGFRERLGDGVGYVVLDSKDVLEGAVVSFRPGNVPVVGAACAQTV